MGKKKTDIICIFVPNGVQHTSRQKNLPYKWEEEDGTFYSVMPREVYNDYLELEEENRKLKSDLSECECSMHYENDEVWFRKREYKRLKKWIKDHCKWYWNLFPEDEMKRQRKKADKKRKKEEIRVARDEHSYNEIWGD